MTLATEHFYLSSKQEETWHCSGKKLAVAYFAGWRPGVVGCLSAVHDMFIFFVVRFSFSRGRQRRRPPVFATSPRSSSCLLRSKGAGGESNLRPDNFVQEVFRGEGGFLCTTFLDLCLCSIVFDRFEVVETVVMNDTATERSSDSFLAYYQYSSMYIVLAGVFPPR